MNINGQLTLDLLPKSEIHALITVSTGELYYSNKLLKECGMSDDIQKVRRSQFVNRKSKNFEFFRRKTEYGETLFFYKCTTIPSPTFIKYNLPSLLESAKFFSKDLQIKTETSFIPQDPGTQRLVIAFRDALDKAYKFEWMFYRNELFSVVSKQLSERYAVLYTLMVYLREPSPKTIKTVHDILMTEPFQFLDFATELNSFYHYLTRAKEAYEKNELHHFVLAKYQVRDDSRKVNEVVTELICFYAGHANGVHGTDVMIWVNVLIIAFPKLNGKKILEIRCVQKVISENPVKINIYMHGEDYVNKVVSAYLHLSKAKHPLDLFSMDEWYIEMRCRGSEKVIRKILLGMYDSHSGKLVHRIQTESLNQDVILSFLHETVKLCRNRMPAELICDFASYNVCKAMRRTFNYLMQKYKNKFFWSPSSNPNSKEIERYWNTVGSFYLKPVVGHIGFSITAQRDNARPAKIMTITLNNPDTLFDELECDRIMDNFFNACNKKGIRADRDSPNEKFGKSKAVNAIQLEDVDMAFCFGIKEERKLSRSEVTIKGRDYQNFGIEHIFETDELVDVYYYQVDNSPVENVFVFKKDTFDLLAEFRYYSEDPKAKINRNEDQKASFGKKGGMQRGQREAIMSIKNQKREYIKQHTNGVDPGEVATGLVALTLPQQSTSVTGINPSANVKIDVDPFDPSPTKKSEQAVGKKSKTIKPVALDGLFQDNSRKKFA